MQCTAQEIEEKRRLAREKLAKKLQSPMKANFATSSSPKFKFNKDNAATKTFNHNSKPYEKPTNKVESNQFYGKDKVVTIKLCLKSESRVVAEMNAFFQPAIEVFKTISSRNYDTSTRNWDFDIKHYDSLLVKLQAFGKSVVIEKLPNYVINCLKTPTNFVDVDLDMIDPELSGALMPFQIEGFRFGVSKNGKCLIADDMGLGKTFQALAIAHYYKEDWPLLVVTTASMKNIWEETIHKYLPSVSIMHTQYMISAKDYIGDSKILIVSHDLMSRALQVLLEKNFGCIIIDESHTLKNFKAKCTQSATELCKKAKRIVLLSGTPALSRPSELFSQLFLLDNNFFGNFFQYSKRYCDGKTTKFGWDASGKSNLQELEIILSKKFMIRRTKDDVLKSLPDKVQEVVKLDVDLKQFSETDRKCLNALAEKYNNAASKKKKDQYTLLLTFFAESAKIKIPSVCSYILQVLETKCKFLVFAHHQVMLNAIENVLKKKGVKYMRIDGNTTSDQRKYFVDKFQFDDNYVCALLSTTAANAGITLTAAQLVIFAELHWNPSILSQAESRAHRIGQQGSVIVKYLLAPKTADDPMWKLLQEKQKILGEIGLSKDSFESVSVKNQEKVEDRLTEDLNITISNRTVSNTLDITTYFKNTNKNNDSFGDTSKSEDSFFDDDGMDDLLCNIDI